MMAAISIAISPLTQKTTSNATCPPHPSSASDGDFMDHWELERVLKVLRLRFVKAARRAYLMGNSMSKSLEGQFKGVHIHDTVRKPSIQERVGPERSQDWGEIS